MTPRPQWLGHFFGGNLGFHNYEILTVQHIPLKDRKIEAELMGRKWFDYRRLHPLQATYYMVRCYNDAYRDFYRKAIDVSRAPFVRGLKEHDFLNAREKMTFWRLRQLCDQMGMRYDFFLRYALNWHKKMIGDGKIYAPRPSHFLKNEAFMADVMIAWEAECEASLQVARDPYYRVSNYVGSRDQQAHEAYIVDQIKKRAVPRFGLHAALYVYDVVRIEEALRAFPVRVVCDAIAENDLFGQVSHN